MSNAETVTCSFTMNRQLYNAYKSIVVRRGANVKGDIIKYMQRIVDAEMPNAETMAALQEVAAMKKNPALGKSYHDVDQMMQELLQ